MKFCMCQDDHGVCDAVEIAFLFVFIFDQKIGFDGVYGRSHGISISAGNAVLPR